MKKRLLLFLLIFLFTGLLKAQEVLVTGNIITANTDESLPGVNIIEKNTENGTVSDVDGNYSITVTDQNSVLAFSFIGYLTEEIQVGNKTKIDMILVPELLGLEEVVVVGYGIQLVQILLKDPVICE